VSITVYGEARQDGDRDRLGHIAAKASRRACRVNRAGGKRVIADHRPAFQSHNATRRAARLVGTRPPLKPIVERRLAGFEILDAVMLRERFGRAERHATFSSKAAACAGCGPAAHWLWAARRGAPETRNKRRRRPRTACGRATLLPQPDATHQG